MKSLKFFNSVCIIILCSILSGALYFQFGLHEDPCPLCLLQRMGMMGVIFGLCLNIFFGFNSKHFGIVIISAIVGVLFSGRQVLLHLCNGTSDPGYGTPFFGMHLYTWGVLIFASCILGAAIFLFFSDRFKKGAAHVVVHYEKYVYYLATLIVLVNIIATLFECQLGPCCEDGPCK